MSILRDVLSAEHYVALIWLAWSMVKNPPERLYR